MQNNKELFLKTARMFIKREGLESLLADLEISDFFLAPASTRHHESYEGGLVEHSLKVFNVLYNDVIGNNISPMKKESVAIVALFHDLCKVGYYKVDTRNTKDEKGKWIQVPYYTVDDKLPFGHGEKSVFLIQEHMKLTLEEAMAIRWHMGGFVSKEEYQYLSKAYSEFPLAVYLHTADLKATYIKKEDNLEK